MTDRVIVHVMVRGRVQGVGYRAWVEDQAILNGVEGWVRNRADRSVEAVFAGSADDVAVMVAACRHGPPAARVDGVTDTPATVDQLALRRPAEEFSVLPTV
ncbi:putative Acylphosphatase [Bradyrhizobium sp. ORS 285]|uniref:acylphosphatase n=1 Tax=Bradyrhizobium sp. ORS 285 TaxID=115808 RepID=UPI0002409A1A|nr:acylphosphatase [Bradyrhizobium sp. ORS 285]CCD85197.1 putative Acylphosphatase [Bradyrhizobium sp. ORS 285]SMX58163.1 putative Acylphosphatase [Bradyrhizobium sp. ORS 285]